MKRFLCAVALMLASVSSFAYTPAEVEQVANVQHNYVLAENMMQQVLQEHPKSAAAHFEMAQVQALEGKLPEARSELQQAKQLDPSLSFDKIGAVGALEAKLQPSVAVQPTAGAPVAVVYHSPMAMIMEVLLWIVCGVFGIWLMVLLWEALFGVVVVQEQIIVESPASVNVQVQEDVQSNRLVRASVTNPTLVATAPRRVVSGPAYVAPAVYYPDPVLSSLAVSNMMVQDAVLASAVSTPMYDPDPYIPSSGGFMDSVGSGSDSWGDSVSFGGGGWGD